jgi:hypothetical protein
MKSKLLFALVLACAPALAVAKGNIEEGKRKAETCSTGVPNLGRPTRRLLGCGAESIQVR